MQRHTKHSKKIKIKINYENLIYKTCAVVIVFSFEFSFFSLAICLIISLSNNLGAFSTNLVPGVPNGEYAVNAMPYFLQRSSNSFCFKYG